MMGPAEEGEVGQVGGAAVQPGDQVVALAPGQGPVTVGEDTAAVADGQGAGLGGGADPAGPAHLQRLAGRPAQDRGQQGHGRLEPVGRPCIAAGVVVAAGVVIAAVAPAWVAGLAAGV